MPALAPLSRPSFRRRFALLGAMALSIGGACRPSDDSANRALLATLPHDRRTDLLEDLTRFDALPTTEQTAIRRLDATLGTLKPDEQARYRALLQHYHVWFQGLTEEQRTSLRAVDDPEERFRIARSLRMVSLDKARRPGSRIARLRTGDFGLVGPFEMAGFLRTWLALPPERRVVIDRKDWKGIQESLKAEGRNLNIRPEGLSDELEKKYDAQLEADGEFRPLIEPRVRRMEQAKNNGNPVIVKKAENGLRHNEKTFAQFLYFEDHPPKAVAPDRLTRFADASPEWLHAQTDSLAADDARAYYTLLYRLIYPAPKEMPEPAPSAPPKPAPSKATVPGGGVTRPIL